MANKLSKLNIGDYTDPILTPSGYLIIKLENKKDNEESEENIEKNWKTCKNKNQSTIKSIFKYIFNKLKKMLS